VLRADNLTTFICPLSSNLGASASLNAHGLFRDCFLPTPCLCVFIFISEQTALYDINRFFITEMIGVYCAARTGSLKQFKL